MKRFALILTVMGVLIGFTASNVFACPYSKHLKSASAEKSEDSGVSEEAGA